MGHTTLSNLIPVDSVNYLIIFFVVIDFWVTKNISGRRMIGIRWYFDNDQYGTERFYFECRANPELLSATNVRLFWILQVASALLPAVFLITAFVIVPNLEAVETRVVSIT
jgi:hypothetical protein